MNKVALQHNGERMGFSINGAGSNEYPDEEKTYLDPYLRVCMKIYSRQIANPNVKGETIKLLEEKIYSVGIGKDFLKRTQKTLTI